MNLRGVALKDSADRGVAVVAHGDALDFFFVDAQQGVELPAISLKVAVGLARWILFYWLVWGWLGLRLRWERRCAHAAVFGWPWRRKTRAAERATVAAEART